MPVTPTTQASPVAADEIKTAQAEGRADPLSDPDVQLMLQVQEGDEKAFRDLFGRFAPKILPYVRRMVGYGARAEELTQDVFVQVFRFRERYRPESRLSTWIFRIATNICLNELRRPEHRLRVDLWAESPGEEEPRDVPLPDPHAVLPEDGAAASQLAGALRREIDALPPKQRAALLLARVDGLAYREIADVLGTSEGAVKALVFRATRGLKARLEGLL